MLLLSIEDDSSLHKCLYYPKDLVAWAKENSECFTDGGLNARTATPQRPHQFPCPETGSWFTTAQSGSRRYLKQDIVVARMTNRPLPTMPRVLVTYPDTKMPRNIPGHFFSYNK